MLWSALKSLRRAPRTQSASQPGLHIGGQVRKAGWEVLNAVPGPAVDHLGEAKDLSRFRDCTFESVYASHVLEHLDFTGEMQGALGEWRRVLAPGGRLYVSVPDLTVLARLFIHDGLGVNDRFGVVKMIFGAHVDAYDYHKIGFDFDILRHVLEKAGFVDIERVERFDLFEDTSLLTYGGVPISLNVIARRPAVEGDS
jgi:predicted SAM-dependent methyltransferase